MSVGVSKLGCTELFFCRTGGENKQCLYYRDVLLTQKLLPVIRQISRNEFVFQQDSAPGHRARETDVEIRAVLYFTGIMATEQSRS